MTVKVPPVIPKSFADAYGDTVPDSIPPQNQEEDDLSEAAIRLTIERIIKSLSSEWHKIQKKAKHNLNIDPLILDSINKIAKPLVTLVELRMKLKKSETPSGVSLEDEVKLFMEWFRSIPRALQEQTVRETTNIINEPYLKLQGGQNG